MINIVNLSLIKELRERTNAGILDCKKALIQANGNIETAIEEMRKSNIIKVAKSLANTATKGVVKIKANSNCGIILEVNCQTDFVARSNIFQDFVDKVLDTVLFNRIRDINILKQKFEDERIALAAKIGENIDIRRVGILEGKMIDSYLHGTRIGVILAYEGNYTEIIKQIAMHIAAFNPKFINPIDIPNEILKKEYQIQLEIAMKYSKSEEIAKKIIRGKIDKFINEICLVNQNFAIDQTKIVNDLIREYNIKILNFIRFEVSEDIKNKNF